MRQIAFPALAAFALLLPASASAAPVNCQAPAGTSGIDQYCEVLPGAGGNGTNHKKKKQHVAPSVTKKLQSQGDAGAAILQLTESSGAANAQTATPPAPVKQHNTRHKKKQAASTPSGSTTTQTTPAKPVAPAARPEPAPADDPFSAVGNSFSTSTGLSGGFVWVLVGIGLVFAAMAWISYRGRTRGTAS